jgi:hypothetical protein
MANIDYDDNYEWLCEKAKIREGLAKEWLYIPIGDDLTELLLTIGMGYMGFEEELAAALDAKYYQQIDDYMEAITDWDEEYGL